jgi:hypothetical protein
MDGQEWMINKEYADSLVHDFRTWTLSDLLVHIPQNESRSETR